MPIPALALGALKYGPAVVSLLKGLTGGKSPQEKAIEKIQQVADNGLDPKILERVLAILNARNQTEQSGVLSRLAAGGIDPSSGLAQEAVGATRRSLGARTGEAQSLFNAESERAKMAANQQLAGLPVDNSTGDLLGSLLQAVQASAQKKFDFDQLDQKLNPPAAAPAQPAANPNIGVQIPGVQDLLRPRRGTSGVGMRLPGTGSGPLSRPAIAGRNSLLARTPYYRYQ